MNLRTDSAQKMFLPPAVTIAVHLLILFQSEHYVLLDR